MDTHRKLIQSIAGGAFAAMLVVLALAVGCGDVGQDVEPAAAILTATILSTAEVHEGLLYGRVTTDDGVIYEGRLRFGGDEEAFWGHYFNAVKNENPWAAHVPRERLPTVRDSIEIFGKKLVTWERRVDIDLDRPFMVRFGDIARIEAPGWDLRVVLKSGTVFELDRFGADKLDGHTSDGEISLRFATIRSIARRSRDSALVTLLDGREMVLSDTQEVGRGNRGIYVDDRRYGRVLVSWYAFERIDFSPGGPGPAYDDFPLSRALRGSVITRSGLRLAGRLVYDLDESETTETLDAPSQGVDYTIPFGLIASIVPPGPEQPLARHARVTLHSGEEVQLERTGDLDEGNAGMLIFPDGRQSPEYVPWTDVERIDFDRLPEMYPPSAPGDES